MHYKVNKYSAIIFFSVISIIPHSVHADIGSAIKQWGRSIGKGFKRTFKATQKTFKHTSEAQQAQQETNRIHKAIGFSETPRLIPKKEITSEEQVKKLVSTLQDAQLQAFLIGASTSAHQCSNAHSSKVCTPEICSWSRFAQEKNLPQPTDEEYTMNLWDNYRRYIDFAADELQLNSLRFSIEWALVQDAGPDSWNIQVLNHYANQFTYAIKKGITPIICLHHYTDPCWFIDMGGFENEENIKYFVDFCTTVYKHIMLRVIQDQDALDALYAISYRPPMWATFNSPEGYAFKGYRGMEGPPADKKKAGLSVVMTVLRNMMHAHVDVYERIHNAYASLDLSREQQAKLLAPRVGFLKNIHQLDPNDKTWISWLLKPMSSFVCAFGNMLQNDAIFEFFTKGKFRVSAPGVNIPEYVDQRAKKALDFIGLNYYSNRYMMVGKSVTESNPKCSTDNGNYRICPGGLYRAIKEMHERLAGPLNIPIYVTENGIATTDDAKRNAFYRDYLSALIKAREDKLPVFGYLTWTLLDNYEWPKVSKRSVRRYGLGYHDIKEDKVIAKSGAQHYKGFAAALTRTQRESLA